jgi:hypothetical protein
MKYTDDGTEVRMGDRVRLYDMDLGTVVCSVDTDEYSEEFPKSWAKTLKNGVLVETDSGALVHMEDDGNDGDTKTMTRIPEGCDNPRYHRGSFPKLSP